MIEEVISSMLAPLMDRISEIEAELENGARRGRNSIQLGVVAKVVGQRVVIAMGKARTPPIKWFALAAGDVIECRYPSQGEIALVLNYGSGDRNSSAIALIGIPSDQFPLPSDDPNLVIRKIGPLGLEEWNKETGSLTIKAPEFIRLDTKLLDCTGEVRDKTRSMSDDRIIYNGHDHGGGPKPSQKQ